MTASKDSTFIGLDVGERRIGVARIHNVVGIAEPLEHIDTTTQDVIQTIHKVVNDFGADGVVVGLPRGLDGQETTQTEYSRDFAAHLKTQISVPVYLIDEAGTSKAADDRMGKNSKFSRDSVAAAILLEDFTQYHNQESLKV